MINYCRSIDCAVKQLKNGYHSMDFIIKQMKKYCLMQIEKYNLGSANRKTRNGNYNPKIQIGKYNSEIQIWKTQIGKCNSETLKTGHTNRKIQN